ncbi:MAG: hypothetical protein JST00_39225 [Deltaproteobacteria bacterium]|nr:hypothetical protein [Deltaproteobacteria bacterium]
MLASLSRMKAVFSSRRVSLHTSVRTSLWLGSLALALVACSAGSPVGTAGAGRQSDTSSTTASCAATATCASPKPLGTVSGDATSGALSVRGTGEGWFAVTVTEDVDAWTGKSLRLQATLRGDPGARLVAYGELAERAPEGGSWPDGGPPVDCASRPVTASRSGDTATLELAWGESLGVDGGSANGVPDGRTFVLAVLDPNGTCGAWQLDVRGN